MELPAVNSVELTEMYPYVTLQVASLNKILRAVRTSIINKMKIHTKECCFIPGAYEQYVKNYVKEFFMILTYCNKRNNYNNLNE